jgi:hypothetical protein
MAWFGWAFAMGTQVDGLRQRNSHEGEAFLCGDP